MHRGATATDTATATGDTAMKFAADTATDETSTESTVSTSGGTHTRRYTKHSKVGRNGRRLSAEELEKQRRQRNRVHAKNTRMRKKVSACAVYKSSSLYSHAQSILLVQYFDPWVYCSDAQCVGSFILHLCTLCHSASSVA